MSKFKMSEEQKQTLTELAENFNYMAERYSQGVVSDRMNPEDLIDRIQTKNEYKTMVSILSKATPENLTPYKDAMNVKRTAFGDYAYEVGRRRETEQLKRREELLNQVKSDSVKRGIEKEYIKHAVKYNPYGRTRQKKYERAVSHYLDAEYRVRKSDRLLRENLYKSIDASYIDDSRKDLLKNTLNRMSDVKLYTLYMSNGWVMRFNYNVGTAETEFNRMITTLNELGFISDKTFDRNFILSDDMEEEE